MILGQLRTFSEPQLPYLQHGGNDSSLGEYEKEVSSTSHLVPLLNADIKPGERAHVRIQKKKGWQAGGTLTRVGRSTKLVARVPFYFPLVLACLASRKAARSIDGTPGMDRKCLGLGAEEQERGCWRCRDGGGTHGFVFPLHPHYPVRMPHTRKMVLPPQRAGPESSG